MLSQSTVFGQKVLWGILSSFLLTVYGTIQGQATRTSLCQIRMAITHMNDESIIKAIMEKFSLQFERDVRYVR